MGEMTKKEIVDILVRAGNALDVSIQYADVFLEYREASANIDANGVIVAHPRTQNPIDNPYLKIRDSALRKFQSFEIVLGVDEIWRSLP